MREKEYDTALEDAGEETLSHDTPNDDLSLSDLEEVTPQVVEGELDEPAMREWLKNWIANATGMKVDQISEDRPIEEFGLASRDVIALSADIEDVSGTLLNVSVAYQHPSIATLAKHIVNPEIIEVSEVEEEYRSFTTKTIEQRRADEVAIVGLATRFPGAGYTPESTWEALINGKDGIRDLPEDRWTEFKNIPQLQEALAKANLQAGYLDDVRGFDAEFFSMSPREVEMVDPQQRLALELCWEALENSYIPPSSVKGKQVGVYIGTTANDYQLLVVADPLAANPYALTGTSSAIIANRVSYFFDFHGPSLAIDTACSSSLVTIHQAIRDLRNGDVELALAGGVNMLITPPASLAFDQLGVQAPNGKIKAFSSDADGFIRAEGGGMIALKRLSDAQRDGDNILAVIAGSAVNQDGRSNGLPAPNPEAQVQVLKKAYKDAGYDPRFIDYVEAHGTGTALGDPIETDALGRVMGRHRPGDVQLLIGSAKTNYGHLEAAAGVAGITKVVLGMQANKIPPSLNYAGPSPYIPFAQEHLTVAETARDWPRLSGIATAGVSGWGFGGTNAHLVVRETTPDDQLSDEELITKYAHVVHDALEDEEQSEQPATEVTSPESATDEVTAENFAEMSINDIPVPLCVSAFLPSRRRKAAARLAEWLTKEGADVPLVDIGRTLAHRNHGRTRSVVLARNHAEAIKGLTAIAEDKPGANVFTSDSPDTGGAAWILSGFGSQHRKMAKQLYLSNAVFKKYYDRVNEVILEESGNDYVEMMLDDSFDFQNIEHSQVGIFAIQVALHDYLKDRGAHADVVIGHSMGEVSAAYIAGGLSLEDAVRVICHRSRLMGEGNEMLAGEWIRRMAIVEYSAKDIDDVIKEHPELEICVYAAPSHTVIGGPEAQVQAVIDRCESEGKLARMLQTKGTSHTRQMEPLLGELTAEIMGIENLPLRKSLFSSVDEGCMYKPGDTPTNQEYFIKGLRHRVWFAQAVDKAIENGHRVFVELSPNPVTLISVSMALYGLGIMDHDLIHTIKRKEDENVSLLQTLIKLYIHGQPVRIDKLFGKGAYAPIPRTEFVRRDYWIDAKLSAGGSMRAPGSHVSLPDGKHVWELSASAAPELTALIREAAKQVLEDSDLTAFVEHSGIGNAETLTTTFTPHPGGGSIQVHAKENNVFSLLADAVVVAGIAPELSPVPAIEKETAQVTAMNMLDEFESQYDEAHGRWSEESGESIEDRLALIIGEAMGYDPDDLPREVPLLDLGLDSLMAVRIKNRVEYEFDIPPLQLQAMREAALKDVREAVTYAVNNRAEVQALYEHQMQEAKNKAESSALESANNATAADTSAVAQTPETEQASPAADTPAATTASTPQANLVDQREVTEAAGAGVPPRDAAERLTFATWALVTGSSAGGIFNTLPILDDPTAQKLAERLSERTGGDIDFEDLLDASNIEEMADVVRVHLEDEITGIVRKLREIPDAQRKPLLVFHPAGGSTVAYEALLRKVPADIPIYGIERVEGELPERLEQYYPVIKELQPEGPYYLLGWSLGGALAYGMGVALASQGDEVAYVGLVDAVLPRKEITDTVEERRERLERYAEFAKRTYDIGDVPIPMDRLVEAETDEDMFNIIMELMQLSKARIPGGIIEHQRTSFLDNRALLKVKRVEYDGYVALYRADRMHDGAIELEPNFADVAPDGGWGEYAKNLEIIPIGGDHLSIIDEPYASKISAHITKKFTTLNPPKK